MKHVAALLLLKLGGKDADAAAIKAVVEAAGGEADEAAITSLLGDIEGKDLNELVQEGKDLLKNVSLGGGGGAAPASGAATASAAAPAAKEEKKAEEEEVDLGAGNMFGGGGDGY